MYNFILENQTFILFACSIFSTLLACFCMTIKFPSKARKKALIAIEISTAILMLFDALSYIYRGQTTTVAYYMVRTSNFLVYTMILLSIYFLNSYITYLFMDTGKFNKVPYALKFGSIIPIVGIVLLVINIFNGMYYVIDEFNRYSRSSLYPLSTVCPLLALANQTIFTYRHKQLTKDRILPSIMMFMIFPIIATLIQLKIYGLSLINFSTFLAASLFFWLSLSDLNAELISAANIDSMTLLPNTYGFIYEFNTIKRKSDITKYNAYYIDVDKMSLLNNRYTREGADQILLSYANELRRFVDKDEVIARFGGDFFGALIKKENTYKFLEKLSDTTLSCKFGKNKELVHVSSTAGIYEIYDHSLDSGKMMSYISNAINYAKNESKKPYAYMSSELEEKINAQRQMQLAIIDGLDNNEFEPFYQPKVDSITKKLCGAEALARWNRGGQYISPGKFIPIMEKNGSICSLDFAMLESLCKDLRRWINDGYEPVPVSINFSRRNLENKKLADDIDAVITKYAIPKDLIQIEVTESIDEYTLDDLKGFVDELKRHNLKTCIDDFGTGSSSLYLIEKVQFDVLKVDKSFIDKLDERSLKILSSILKLANELDMTIVAEGVEKIEQLQILNQMGCNIIQGYWFDKPLNKQDFEKRLVSKMY